MSSRLNKSQRRLLALSLLFFCIVLVFGAVVVPLADAVVSYNEKINDLQFNLLRFKKTATGKLKVENQLKQLKVQRGKENQFSNRETPALASADLQQLIKKAVLNVSGRLVSTQVIPETEEEHLIKISVVVRMTGDTLALRNVLYELETARPMLLVNNLTIRPGPGRRDRRTRRLIPSNELNVNFDVSGYMRVIQN
ncbi:MAG: type II secretion system protein GspM [Methylococcales bacterium]